MAGIHLLLDLWRKSTNYSATQTLYSHGLSTTIAASVAAAASLASGTTLASKFLFGNVGFTIAYADAGAEWSVDNIRSLRSVIGNIFEHDSIKYNTKEYPLELKPVFSAFGMKAFAMTSVRSLLMFYLPLLEPRSGDDDDDGDDFLEDKRPDLIVPLKKSVKQIIRETSVVTTRRVLERLAVHYVSRRMAWKLLKDVPRSARRKALRGMPHSVYFYNVSRTTFRGHLLGVAASWLVQIGIHIYRYFKSLASHEDDEVDRIDNANKLRLLGKKVTSATLRCCASLIFASIGAGIGATFIQPSVGQWLGCAAGDLAGPIIVGVVVDKVLHLDM